MAYLVVLLADQGVLYLCHFILKQTIPKKEKIYAQKTLKKQHKKW